MNEDWHIHSSKQLLIHVQWNDTSTLKADKFRVVCGLKKSFVGVNSKLKSNKGVFRFRIVQEAITDNF